MSKNILETRVTKQKVYKSVKNNSLGWEYNTPLAIYRYLNQFYEFKIDPCAMQDNNWLDASICYTREDDGLTKEWNAATFVNPPYGYGNEEKWVKKAIYEYDKYAKPIFILLPSKTEMPWFKLAMGASVIIIPEGRIQFVKDGEVKRGNQIGSIIVGFCSIRDQHNAHDSPFNKFKWFNRSHNIGPDYASDIQHWFFPSTQKIMEYCR